MPFTVVLDTCVIYPAHLRDTLLRQAERGLYRALWSDDILDELRRNLVEDGFGVDSVDRLLTEMRRAFPDAEIGGYRSLIDGLTCDPKDRHVLAAAVRADAAAIVSFNIRDNAARRARPRARGRPPKYRCSRAFTSKLCPVGRESGVHRDEWFSSAGAG